MCKYDDRWYAISANGKIASKAIGDTGVVVSTVPDSLKKIGAAKDAPVAFALGKNAVYRCNRNISPDWEQVHTSSYTKIDVAGLTGDTLYFLRYLDPKIYYSYNALSASPDTLEK